MTAEVRDPRFSAVIGETVEVEKLGSGFQFTEGPIWHHLERHLTFSDMPGDHMRRWWPDSGLIETFRKPSDMANGNAYDRLGRMVSCQHATSSVTRTEADGSITTLATHFEGKELNSPNDIIVNSDGRIFFTDPTYGRMPVFGVERDCELDFQGVYSMNGDGSDLRCLADDFGQPNGLCLSVDETTLFVNDTDKLHIRRFDIADDGSLKGGDVWASPEGDKPGHPDGMKVDCRDNLYCTGPGGVQVFAPDAACLGVILVPEMVANFTWGDDDMRSIFFTASTSLYRCRTNTPGLHLF
ncbi:SMP-30/gluconolactonase/LRE family protein [Hoeflea prorocentri]|uniref:SMP-30/gluconolactonase/LRE family protein n=1 Tax=Hoeflea prorocentri TaxID=1922333 RepID=A0A9X3ZK70_9HYPH|nr:SMP-30/gluconolactonase/LRE family protein [Hoeflea prorocentri]MCY6383716.1 SMP-30/gluconolactonase/LRE family protein [Hoeflea prorocentri]MDA5401516.1 SMP-30/gluconolactonase/LRE family protein [Hoeflea prorocentri]